MTNSTAILDIYRQTGAMKEGHFLLASGMHAAHFFQSAAVMQHPELAGSIGAAIAEKWRDIPVDFVIGPAIGGILLAALSAQHLGARALFAEKDASTGGMFIRDGLAINGGERFIAVEDVITTGNSVLRAVRAAERAGGVFVGISAVIDRSDDIVDFTVPYRPLVRVKVENYLAAECPLCRQGIPLEKI